MSQSKITCPHCGAGLKSSRTLPVGKQVTCLKCQAPFTISRADGGMELPPEDPTPLPGAPLSNVEIPAAGRQRTCKLHLEDAPAVGVLDIPAAAPIMEDPLPTGIQKNPTTPAPLPVDVPAASFAPAARSFALPIPLPAEPAPLPKQSRGKMAMLIGGAAFCLLAGVVVAWICFFGDSAWEQNASDQSDNADHIFATTFPPQKNKQAARQAQAENESHSIFKEPEQKAPASATPPDDPPKPAASPEDKPAVPAPVKKNALPPHPQQKKIDRAIERGSSYLKGRDTDWLGIKHLHTVGFAALPGLTLLECENKSDDPVVQKVASYIRRPKTVNALNTTYDLSLAILFLDRLGNKQDVPLIQTFALRLVAGQTAAGGWDYYCPVVKEEDAGQLLNFLKDTRPQPQLFNPVEKGGDPKGNPTPAEPKDKSDSKDVTKGPKQPRPELLTEFVRDLPIVQSLVKGKKVSRTGVDDNSNTQFAMLALWAARRHDVPTERTLAFAEQRFLSWQRPNGGWSYRAVTQVTPSMTCVGLLGLALGHGSSDEGLLFAAKKINKEALPKTAKEDPAILNGLRALAKHIGAPHPGDGEKPPMANLYFLWSVERVAVLYNLPTIGNKDWYSWGVSVLLPNQKEDGGWHSAPYPGHGTDPAHDAVDTCFAMLFLKRSNLVSDLTENLMFYMAIPDPGKKR